MIFFSMIEHEDGSSDQDDEPYLHPSLAPSFTKIEAVGSAERSVLTRIETYLSNLIQNRAAFFQAPSIPSIQYKPSADCAYSMLVNKITGKPPPSRIPAPPQEPTVQPTAATGYYHPMAGQVRRGVEVVQMK